MASDVTSEYNTNDNIAVLQTELQKTVLELELTKKYLAEAQEWNKQSEKKNADLRLEIEKLNCLLKLYQTTSSSELATAEIGIQVNANDIVYDIPQWQNGNDEGSDEEGEVKDEPATLAESLKEAAESAMQQSGFVYDETTGLYYDHKSGYYYDSEKQLYYEPTHGTYYYYDPESKSYQFHSQVDLSQYNYANYLQPQEQPNSQAGVEASEIPKVNDQRKRKEKLRKKDKDELNSKKNDEIEKRKTKKRKKRKRERQEKKSRSHKKKLKVEQMKEEVKTYSATPIFVSKDLSTRLVKISSPERLESTKEDSPIEVKSDTELDVLPDLTGMSEEDEEEQMEEVASSLGSEQEETIVKDTIGPNMDAYLEYINKQKETSNENIQCEAQVMELSKVESSSMETGVLQDNNASLNSQSKNTEEVLYDESILSFVLHNDPSVSNPESVMSTDNDSSKEVKAQSEESLENNPNNIDDNTDEKLDCSSKKMDNTDINIIANDVSEAKDENENQNFSKPKSDLEDGEISDSEDDAMNENIVEDVIENVVREDKCKNIASGSDSGEILSCSSSSSDHSLSSDSEIENDSDGHRHGGASIHWPPCIRIMVTASSVLTTGSLYIVTCSGATIGRDQNLGHIIILPDEQVSKMHCSINYSEEIKKYMIKDHASQNGTFLNSQRLSKVKKISECYSLEHLDTLQIGGSHFSLHIHPGAETCEGCEPGQVQACQLSSQSDIVVLSSKEKEKLRKKELKQIKKKYGLESMGFVNNESVGKNYYTDKAAERRTKVGSDHPYQKDDAPSSVHVAISTENKGHKLLSKMGWKEGDSLGKSIEGIKEPIQAELRPCHSAGLGSYGGVTSSLDSVQNMKRNEKWFKATQRYHNVPQQLEQDHRKSNETSSEEKTVDQKKNKTKMTFVQGETFM